MKRPPWLPKLTGKDERTRAAHGLTPKIDGWYKSIDGDTRYICKPCPVPEVALLLPARVDAIRERLKGAGAPQQRVTAGTLSLEDVAAAYLEWLYQRHTTGVPRKLARRTYDDNVLVVGKFVEIAGPSKPADAVGPAAFSAYARQRLAGKAPNTVRREVQYLEAFANWAAPGSRKAGLLLRPWQYGQDFAKPSADEISASAADSDKAYSPAQLRGAFLAVKGSPLLRAVGYVALCAAMQPKDLGLLPEAVLDLDAGLIRFPRGKTGVGRLCALNRAAVLAVRAYLKVRPAASEDAAEPLLFRTVNGKCCYREGTGEGARGRTDRLGCEWSAATGLPLSGLRSTFATHADAFPDQRAVDTVMGHKSGHSGRSVRSKHYAKRVDPERVRKLLAFVWPLAWGRKAT